jgi:GTPase SAR1 family protein
MPQAVIFMVDSTDCERFEEAKNQLHLMLSDDLLQNVTVLVLANKQVALPVPVS